jgi:arsenate reductase (glutaredoxin)
MKSHKREIIVYCNPESSSGKMTTAYARSLSHNVVIYSFEEAPPTETGWRGILEMLNMHPKELLDKSQSYYQEAIRGRDFDDEGWLHVIKRNPKLIKFPIAIRGNQAVFCHTPTAILKLINPSNTKKYHEDN